MKFPIQFETETKLQEFLKNEKEYILNFYNIDKKIKKLKTKLKERKQQHREELERLEKENKELQELAELKEKQLGEHSMYKGEFDEKQKEHILNQYFSQDFEIDGTKKMHCMDIRMNHKTKKYTIGIECKNKKNIIQNDIDKFKNDKLRNNFKLSVFLSTESPIRKIVLTENNYVFENNELYIYSKDTNYIIILIQVFSNLIECDEEDSTETFCKELYIDIITNTYKNWCNLKKHCVKMDQDLVNSLKKINIELVNGHLFIASKSKLKKQPY